MNESPPSKEPLKRGSDGPFRKPGQSGIRPLLIHLYRKSPSWLVSVVVHAALIFLLALWSLPNLRPQSDVLDVAAFESLDINDQDVDFEIDADDQPLEENSEFAVEAMSELPDVSVVLHDDLDAAVGPIEVADIGIEFTSADMISDVAGSLGQGFDGRGASRATLVKRGGGNAASEKSVNLALLWLANHQRQDGSWSFDHRKGACNGRCGNPGNLTDARKGATGLALLPFLAAGCTQRKGPYTEVVGGGLNALVGMIKSTPDGGSLIDQGRMYSHGIATMALCEAYGMTRQSALKAPANAALRFICRAQDPKGGGWRYHPRDPGDTSVTGWQIMALKSGHMASLTVPKATIDKARTFLDSMQVGGGERYLYRTGGEQLPNIHTMTPIAFLCRMHMGWRPDNEILSRGILLIAELGPSTVDAYFNYYATQLLFQYTGGRGRLWQTWNVKIRDHLISTQVQQGHEAGSWFVPDEASPRKAIEGGRLYYTALCCMTLEVYYRHMPVYKDIAADNDF